VKGTGQQQDNIVLVNSEYLDIRLHLHRECVV
jgi:hypothetical protein